ncbi:MAG: GspMb/PilO family protein [Pyrinomonadaceae bacterium]
MSEPTPDKNASSARTNLRARVDTLRGSRPQSYLGTAEIAALAASFLMLLAVAFAYFYSLTPARTRLEELQRKRTQLQVRLRDAQDGVKLNTNTQASVVEIGESLQNFENHYLAQRIQGRTSLIDQLNALVRRNNVRVSTGVSFTPLEALALNSQTRTGTTVTSKPGVKGQTSFPGTGVSLTVEGQYANLRHLVRDIEASNQFIVINAVELQGITDAAASRVALTPGAGAPGAPAPSVAATRTALVSLRLDLAAYFRRDAVTSIQVR